MTENIETPWAIWASNKICDDMAAAWANSEKGILRMNDIGHNKAPDMTITASETMQALSDFMSENPVIQTIESAGEAKVYIDRAKLCVLDLEAEREEKVKPLNQQVQHINDHYRAPRTLLQKVLDELKNRVSAFLRAEEVKRERAAEAAMLAAREAERIARDAESLEKLGIANASAGEIGIDIAEQTRKADEAFSAYQKAERQAVIAQRDIKAKITGGFSRAIGLKTETTLIVVDEVLALQALGLTEYIREAMIKSARAYKKLHGKYPLGIEATKERKI